MANVPVTFTGDPSRLLQALNQLEKREEQWARKQQEGAEKAGQAHGKTGQAVNALDKSVGSMAMNAVKNFAMMAAGGLGVRAVIGKLKEALAAVNQEIDKAAQRQQQERNPLAKLSQLAGTPQELDRMIAAARQTRSEGRAGSLEEAARLQFALESAGAGGEREFFSRLNLVDNAEEMARTAATLRANLGEKETGSYQAIVSKAFAAAAPSPTATAGGILTAAGRGAVGAARLGLSDEDLMAATSILAEKTRSTDVAGERIGALFNQLVKKGFKADERGLGGIIADLQAKGMSDKALAKYMGDVGAGEAFGMLSTADLGGRIASIREAERTDLAARQIGMAEAVPEIEAALALAEAEGSREQATANIERGRRRNVENAVVEMALEGAERGGLAERILAQGGRMAVGAMRTAGIEEPFMGAMNWVTKQAGIEVGVGPAQFGGDNAARVDPAPMKVEVVNQNGGPGLTPAGSDR